MINKLKTVRKLSGFICNSSSSDYICNGEYEWDLEISECYDPEIVDSEYTPDSPMMICEECCNLRVQEGNCSYDDCHIYKENFVKVKDESFRVISGVLDLSAKNITSMEEIEGLSKFLDKNLTVIDLSNNEILKVDGNELHLCLEELNLSVNPIKSLSNILNIGEIINLKLSNCEIEDLASKSIFNSLESLDVSNNKIENFKILNTSHFPDLTSIDLKNNNIRDLIELEKLGKLENLRNIELKDNPLEGRDKTIVRGPWSANQLIEYARKKRMGETQYVDYIKPELGPDENINSLKELLKEKPDLDFINIGTHLENKIVTSMQNFVFHNEKPEEFCLQKKKSKIEKIRFHLIQIHSLKGISYPSEVKNRENFYFFLRHFWEIDELDNKQALIYGKFLPRAISKLGEIISLSIEDTPKPNVLVFPENSIPYKYIEELKEISIKEELIIIGGLEDKALDGVYTNQALIIDNGKCGYQEKQTPVMIGNKIEAIECKTFPKITVFETTIGRVAIFVCKDFLRLCGAIPHWSREYNVNYIFIPALSNRMLPFHYNMHNLLKNSSYPPLCLVFCNIGEFGGSEIFSLIELDRIDQKIRKNISYNMGEIIVQINVSIKKK